MTSWIKLCLAQQRLELLEGRDAVAAYDVSTSRNGGGERIPSATGS
ncbi:MAG: hypothetical protein V3V67_17610 [Myxococcota bacterium]